MHTYIVEVLLVFVPEPGGREGTVIISFVRQKPLTFLFNRRQAEISRARSVSTGRASHGEFRNTLNNETKSTLKSATALKIGRAHTEKFWNKRA